jgi:hypothetical protein
MIFDKLAGHLGTHPMRQRKPRELDDGHLKWIRTLPCIACGRTDSVEAAHIRYGNLLFGKRGTGLGERADDRWVTPLCRECHQSGPYSQHGSRSKGEREWWALSGIDPCMVAAGLALHSGDDDRAHMIINAWRCRR